jgi:hypothetical protein
VTYAPRKPKALDKIKEAWDENPLGVAIVAAGLLTAAGKLIDSISGIQSRRAYARQGRRKK